MPTWKVVEVRTEYRDWVVVAETRDEAIQKIANSTVAQAEFNDIGEHTGYHAFLETKKTNG